ASAYIHRQSLNPISNADGTVSKRQPFPVSIITRKALARMMLYGSRETENSLWNDVLPIVSCAAKTPCIQHVAHNVDSSGSMALPDRRSAPWRRVTIRSL